MEKKNSGFSLVELLIVVAIIGILAVVGVPSYGKYLARGKVTTAQSDLVLLSLRFENLYQRVLSYPAVGKSTTAELESLMSGWKPASDAADFTFSNDNASHTSYTLKATGKKGRYSGCVVTLTHDGAKTIDSCTSMASDSKWL